MALDPQYDANVRGSIGDCERRLHKAQEALANAVESLDQDDPEGAKHALDEAALQSEAATGEIGTTQAALKVARERSA